MTRLNIDTASPFFSKVFMKVCREVKYPKNEVTILYLNADKSQRRRQQVKDKIKFKFDYPNDNEDIVGIEVFYLGEV